MSEDFPQNEYNLLKGWMERLESKLEGISDKIEEKNNNNYRKLEDKIEATYGNLEDKITEYIETNNKTIDSVKDRLQDHEYRIRNVESNSKSTNDKMIELLGKHLEEPKIGFFKKFTKIDSIVILVIIILIFISGNFNSLVTMAKVLLKIS